MAEQLGPNQASPAPGEAVMKRGCPACGARPLQRCTTSYGLHSMTPHKARVRAAA